MLKAHPEQGTKRPSILESANPTNQQRLDSRLESGIPQGADRMDAGMTKNRLVHYNQKSSEN